MKTGKLRLSGIFMLLSREKDWSRIFVHMDTKIGRILHNCFQKRNEKIFLKLLTNC